MKRPARGWTGCPGGALDAGELMGQTVMIHWPRKQSAALVPDGVIPAPPDPPALAFSPLPMGETVPAARSDVSTQDAEAIEQAALARANAPQPAVTSVTSERPKVLEKMQTWAQKHREAKAANVDLRRATFVNKRTAVVASLFSLGAAIALTAGTAGATSPLVIVTAVRTGILIADCLCAYLHWKLPPATAAKWFPMGGRFLDNVIHHAATNAFGAKPGTAHACARWGGAILAVGMAGATAGLGFSYHALDLGVAVCRYVAGIGAVGASVSQAQAGDTYDPVAQARDAAAARFFEALRNEARKLGPHSQAFRDFCEQLRQALQKERADPALEKEFVRILGTIDKTHEQLVESDFLSIDRVNIPQRLSNDLIGLQSTLSIGLSVLKHVFN